MIEFKNDEQGVDEEQCLDSFLLSISGPFL